MRTTHVRRDILKTLLLEISKKVVEKRLNSRNLSKKNFYYFGVSTILDFYRIKILGRRQIVYYNGVFYYNGFYYNGVRLYSECPLVPQCFSNRKQYRGMSDFANSAMQF